MALSRNSGGHPARREGQRWSLPARWDEVRRGARRVLAGSKDCDDDLLMGANTACFVKVAKIHYEWIEISAVHLAEAEELALKQDGVVDVIHSQYEDPETQDRE